MREFSFSSRLRVAAILVAGLLATQGAIASQTPMNSGYVRYTAKETTVGRAVPASESQAAAPEPGTWQLARVDASILSAQSAMIGTRPATFDSSTASVVGADVRAANQSMLTESSAPAGKGMEPGFWATALSTLALGLFFFLRRLA